MTEFRWLIEAPGRRYLAARKVGNYEFNWTEDHNAALAFRDETQADMTMMAIRELAPKLFGFEVTLGNARAVEHGWLCYCRRASMTHPMDGSMQRTQEIMSRMDDDSAGCGKAVIEPWATDEP